LNFFVQGRQHGALAGLSIDQVLSIREPRERIDPDQLTARHGAAQHRRRPPAAGAALRRVSTNANLT
jgi:hypothetical protein